MHAIPDYNDAVESEAGLGAIPSNELVNGILVHTARSWRAEAIEHCQFAMIQIRQPKHSATVVRLDSLFAHSDGLPMPQLCGRRRPPGRCNQLWDRQVLSAMAWLR